MLPDGLIEAVAGELGELLPPRRIEATSGGDINQACTVQFARRRVFVKYGGVDADGFRAEAQALEELGAACDRLKIPTPLTAGEVNGVAYLVLEHLHFTVRTASSEAFLGRELARLHRPAQPFFGWQRDNRIGATAQPNGRSDDWQEFFLRHRLRHQARLLGDDQIGSAIDELAGHWQGLFEGHRPYPSLLHGDLWGGNWAALEGSKAAIFDPASYYGCRETDLAMTELFGGFSSAFYRAYNDELPLAPGYRSRRPIYQLYHVLNHANLFGAGYRRQARAMLAELCS